MKQRIISKGLSVAVIVLFIGLAIQPSVAKFQPEDIDIEYFEVTTDFIGLDKKFTTQLTKEEIEELDFLFNLIYYRVNNSKSIIESIEIFKEAIIELDSFGLLGDVGIQEAEKFVTNCYQNPKLVNVLDRLNNRINSPLSEDENRFCFVTGKTKGLVFLSPIVLTLTVASIILMYLLDTGNTYFFDYMVAIIAMAMLAIPSIFIPFCLIRMIGLEDWAEGTIISFGIYGLKSWNGYLKGIIKGFEDIGVGVFGFTGLKIEVITSPNQYLLGFATHVHIEES